MKALKTILIASAAVIMSSCGSSEKKLTAGTSIKISCPSSDFVLTGEAMTDSTSTASIMFDSDGKSGYEVMLHGGPIDGSIKNGSLCAVRNLYRSIVPDGEWFKFKIAVTGKNISIKLNDTEVVCYTEPQRPYRIAKYSSRILGKGDIYLKGASGTVKVRNVKVEAAQNTTASTMPPADEQHDDIIRLQQQGFPVIDYHVHLKGGLTKEMAHTMSMKYGINYGVAPNAGEGGVGRMLRNDQEARDYYNEVKDMPFLRGVQGEGRRWVNEFSPEVLNMFDYLFTDAMTIRDFKGNIVRIYHPEEVHFYGKTREQWMDHLVSQIVRILSCEPADIYANATYIPDDMMPDYDKLWTPERVDRVLNVLKKYSIAMEINARYRIPSFSIIKRAKAMGIKFTFGTNNVDANFGKLEYPIEAIKECGLTPQDIWFPTMSVKKSRKAIPYDKFSES